MTAGGRPCASADGDGRAAEWPVDLRGVTESLVTTLGPNDRWNVAALGLHAPEAAGGEDDGGGRVTAVTWGRTRTRGNFHRRGGGYVQFATDPELFVAAALEVREVDEPVLDAADAWVEVRAEPIDGGESDGTEWEEWALTPVDSEVVRERVPTTNRGYYAVVEATVAASRLDVDAYDERDLLDRLEYLAGVVDAAGGPAERRAFERVGELTGWRDRR